MIHVNDVVLVKLTKRGAFMVNEQNKELMYRFPQQKLKTNYREGEWYEQYMWVLMKHFGYEFTLGREAPFTDIHLAEPSHPQDTPTKPEHIP